MCEAVFAGNNVLEQWLPSLHADFKYRSLLVFYFVLILHNQEFFTNKFICGTKRKG